MKSHFFYPNKLHTSDGVRKIMLILAGICMVCLCGCGGGGRNTQNQDVQGQRTQEQTIQNQDAQGQTVQNQDLQRERAQQDKPVIVCTLFPQYDFARTVFGDDAEVIMLLKPGMESHMFDPTPQDMVTISHADAFIYTGDEMEPWAAQIAESLDEEKILDLSRYVHLEMEDHEGHDHEGAHHGHSHEHSYDPHFWLDMDNAQLMIEAISDLAQAMVPEDAENISQRASAYCRQLADLDAAYFDALEEAEHTHIVFAGRFAYGYFVHRYDLHYETVYQSCAANVDPSIYDMARVIDYIKENGTKIIFYEELSNASVAKTIAQDTGVQIRMLSTAHNVTKEEFDAGITFYDVMAGNLEVLKESLNLQK